MARRPVFALFCKLGTSVSVPVALTVLLSCSGARPVSAQDAKTVLQNMMNMYHGLNSYQGQANASIRQAVTRGGTISVSGFTTTLIYQRPNKLKLEFTSPQGGNTVLYDGTTLTFYQVSRQVYSTTRVNAENMRELCSELLKLRIAGRFDTLYFLAGNNLPPAVIDIKRQSDDTRNGRPVFVVTAREKTPKAIIAWTWMIDKQTNALAKIEGRTTNPPGTLKFMQNNRTVSNSVPMDSILTQNIVAPKLNVNLDPGAFVFKPLANVQKISFEAAIQQQQQRFGSSTSAPANPGK